MVYDLQSPTGVDQMASGRRRNLELVLISSVTESISALYLILNENFFY